MDDYDDESPAIRGTNADLEPRGRRYPEEDTTPTTQRELRGWYFYGIAAEAYAVCGPGSFLPVTLEALARASGVLWSDRKTPCHDPSASSSNRLLMGRDAATKSDQCVVNVLGAGITTASFAMYTFSAAVFIQALALVSFSSVADYGSNRKRFLVIFASVGSIAGMMFLFINPSIFLLAPPLAILTIMSLGCSFVMLNAFLPLLASNHPKVRAQEKELLLDMPSPSPNLTPAIPFTPLPPVKSQPSPALAFSNAVSARGVGLGYAAAVFVQLLCIAILFLNSHFHLSSSPTIPLRLSIFLSSTWWLIFTIPTYLWLRDRPGPPLPAHLASTLSSTTSTSPRIQQLKFQTRQIWSHTTFAWSSLYCTLRLALTLTQLRLFLLAWFMMSDAIATVGSTAIMFARTELHLSPIGIALLSISSTCSGILGTLIWPRLASYYSLRSSRTIVACLLVMLVIPLYGLLGYLPFIQHLGWGGLQQQWEIFPLSVVYGIAMGGLSSYCRSFYGQLAPRGKEASFYALFAITDKGSSAVGPAVVGRVVDRWGTIRPAFWVLVVLIGVPVGIVWFVDEDRGRREAEGVGGGMEGGADGLEMREGVRREEGGGGGVQGEETEGLMYGRRSEEGDG